MITRICKELRNWFVIDKIIDNFIIADGVITPSVNLKEDQYYRIVGSIFNDGVYKHGTDDLFLTNEEFEGAIWLMAIPKEVLELATKIEEFETKYGEFSPYSSESFGGYSYSRNTDANGANLTWQTVFANQLNLWRKI